MDDPHLQRAIYASIQTARSQGYNLGSGKGSGQSFRPSFQPARGGGGGRDAGNGNHGASTHRSTTTYAGGHGNRNQPYLPQPQSRSYAGNSLPGVSTSASASTGGSPASNPLRTSFGRVEALRRDGIVPSSAGPLSPPSHVQPHSRATHGSHGTPHPPACGAPPPGSSSLRALPTAIPPRVASSPQRLRNKPQQPQARPRPGMQSILSGAHRAAHPVLEAIAVVTADAHAAAEAAAAGVTPITVTPLSPNRAAAAAAVPPSARSPTAAAAAAAATALRGSGGFPSTAVAAAAPVGGSGPPPRALVPVAAPGGQGVVLVPEGVDPGLTQVVLRDAVTWDTGVTFDDIAGCQVAKQLLHEAVVLPLIIPEFFTGIREPWRGVLLHGPPGNGKTMLAKAVAGMVGGAFFAVSIASLTSKWRGESEKLLAALFTVARAHAPAIIFIDEVDALGATRGADGEHEASRRFKAELLQQMDGLASGRGVMVLAATNCPWDLDPALRRRLEKRIHIGLPDAAQRLVLLQLHLRGLDLAPNVDLLQLAAACEGFSGADIRLLCRDAAMAPLRRQIGGLAFGGPGAPQQLQPQQSASPSRTGQEHSPAGAATQSPAPQAPAPQDPQAAAVLRSAADIRRLADSGELARGAVVAAADLEAALGAVKPSVTAEQAARYVQWDREFASA